MKTKKRVIGKQFGPGPHQYDPFGGMTDKEFEADVFKAFEASKQGQKAISIKLPEELLERTRAEAKRQGIPCLPPGSRGFSPARSKDWPGDQ